MATMTHRPGRPAIILPAHEIEAYRDGATADAIASRVGHSRRGVLNALRRANVVVRPSGPIPRSTPKAPRVERSPEELFWSHVEKVNGGCWPWNGASLRGYGRFNSRGLGRQGYSHRFAWEFTNGPIPDGLHVLHRCDNPPCCNPDHLFIGTHIDNVADMVAKGRGAKGERHGSRTHPGSLPRGENHSLAKLTAAQVAEIREAPRKRGSQRSFARRFGVSEATVSMIVSGKTWSVSP